MITDKNGRASIPSGIHVVGSFVAGAFGNQLHHHPTARSVILLFMAGGPSQVDTLDPKPTLEALAAFLELSEAANLQAQAPRFRPPTRNLEDTRSTDEALLQRAHEVYESLQAKTI